MNSRERPPYEWRGMVATLLASGLVATLVLIELFPNHLSSDETTLLSTVLGALVGALATYLGVPHHNGDSDNGPK